jgi:nitric oxide reductase subunit B
MKYQSQKVAYAYFMVAMGLFGIQVLGGLLAGWIYVSPNTLSEVLPFNIIRMIHTNALIVWLLLGFFGAAYFLVPEESEREIWSVKLAYLQLIILVVGTLGAVGSYLVGIHGGREFLEQPLWVKFGILVAAVIFLINISMTVLAGRKTAITGVLLTGLWLLSLLWIFAFINPDNLSLDKMYWWFVVHLWVEGTWELVMAAILAFLMLKLTGVDREVVEKWLYVIVTTSTGLACRNTGSGRVRSSRPSRWFRSLR